jgi:hypothetical protein
MMSTLVYKVYIGFSHFPDVGLGGLSADQHRNEVARRVRQISYSTGFTGTDVLQWTLDLALYHIPIADDNDNEVCHSSDPFSAQLTFIRGITSMILVDAWVIFFQYRALT